MTVTPRTDGASRSPEEVDFAIRRRRASMQREAAEQTRLVGLLTRHLDPALTFWTSLENKPRSMLAGILQRKRGVRSGLPDLFVCFRRTPSGPIHVVFIELKSRSGVATKAQKQIRLEMLPAGVKWYLVRSARAAMVALKRNGVPFKRAYPPVQLEPWEGPFADPTQRLPRHPLVAAEQRAARLRWRARQRAREAALSALCDSAGLPATHDAQVINISDAPGAIASRNAAEVISLAAHRRR